MNKISVIVLNFNGYKSTIDCVRSLGKCTVPNDAEIKILVIDNDSRDGSFEKIRETLPKTEILTTGKNLGFTGGNNFGMKHALSSGADYVVILNNDTRADKDLIKNLYNSIKNDDKAGGVLPKIYFEKGFEYHKDKYKEEDLGKVIWYAGGLMDWGNIIGKNIGVDEVDRGQFDKREEAHLATGCCFMIKAEVIKNVGMFDDKFFLYYEDADLTQRIKKAGYKIYYEPSALLWHKNAESTGGSGSPLQDYFITRNRLLFGMRYAPLRTKIALIREATRFLINGRPWQKEGVIDFYLRKFGQGSYKV